MFIVPAKSFDNVSGDFPIGFMIWRTNEKHIFNEVIANVYDADSSYIEQKRITSYDNYKYINDWIKPYRASKNDRMIIGKIPFKGNDFQNQRIIQIVHPNMKYNTQAGQFLINPQNLSIACVYFAVRKTVKATWLNDRDQFIKPSSNWFEDNEFKNDCLVYTLFNNVIQSKYGVNHWIPFSEKEVGAQDTFDSHFMYDYINGKYSDKNAKAIQMGIFDKNSKDIINDRPLIFSHEAQQVIDCARELWKYYHKQKNANPNASLYDIRMYFQGTKVTPKGKIIMNPNSKDETYTSLLHDLRSKHKILSDKIVPKVFEYGFLK